MKFRCYLSHDFQTFIRNKRPNFWKTQRPDRYKLHQLHFHLQHSDFFSTAIPPKLVLSGSLNNLLWVVVMTGENRQLVTNEPVEVQDCRIITDHFRGICRIYLNLIKENQRMSTCNRLDLQTLGSQSVMPKNLPNHWVVENSRAIWIMEMAACTYHQFSKFLQTNVWKEPAVSYKWTSWVWGLAGWSSRLQENYRSV